MSKVFIGTSGWTYDGWRGPFYLETLRKSDWLTWYASQFPTTEINGSFYRTPSLDAVRSWRDQTPRDFLFAWKASKFITHWKRLGETCPHSIELMESRLKALSPKVGAVLFAAGLPFKELFTGHHGVEEFFGEAVKMDPHILESMHHIPEWIGLLPIIGLLFVGVGLL